MNTIEVDCNDIEENVVQDSNPKKSTIVCGEKKSKFWQNSPYVKGTYNNLVDQGWRWTHLSVPPKHWFIYKPWSVKQKFPSDSVITTGWLGSFNNLHQCRATVQLTKKQRIATSTFLIQAFFCNHGPNKRGPSLPS